MEQTLPREKSFMYDFVYGSNDQKRKKQRQLKFWNKWFVIPLYRINLLQLFGMGRIFLLLYHVGRKSGKQYITPLEYRKKDSKVLVFASRGEKTDWFRNTKANLDKTRIKVGFRTYNPKIRFPNVDEKIEIMQWYVSSFTRAAKMLFGWKKEDEPTEEFLRPIAEFLEIIEFDLD